MKPKDSVLVAGNVDWEGDELVGLKEEPTEMPETAALVDIDWLIHDVLIIKAEALKDKKILAYADALEKNLFMIKKGEAILEL